MPVERIDDPAQLAVARLTALLPQDCVRGTALAQAHGESRPLATRSGLGNGIGGGALGPYAADVPAEPGHAHCCPPRAASCATVSSSASGSLISRTRCSGSETSARPPTAPPLGSSAPACGLLRRPNWVPSPGLAHPGGDWRELARGPPRRAGRGDRPMGVAGVVADGLTGYSPGRRLTREHASQNVVSRAANEPDQSRVRLIVTANYDAADRPGLPRCAPPRPRLRRLAGPSAFDGWAGFGARHGVLLVIAVRHWAAITGSAIGVVIPTAGLVFPPGTCRVGRGTARAGGLGQRRRDRGGDVARACARRRAASPGWTSSWSSVARGGVRHGRSQAPSALRRGELGPATTIAVLGARLAGGGRPTCGPPTARFTAAPSGQLRRRGPDRQRRRSRTPPPRPRHLPRLARLGAAAAALTTGCLTPRAGAPIPPGRRRPGGA